MTNIILKKETEITHSPWSDYENGKFYFVDVDKETYLVYKFLGNLLFFFSDGESKSYSQDMYLRLKDEHKLVKISKKVTKITAE